MPRANRCYIPNQVWHITHRCHKKEFLLKFVCDRRRWRYWLFQARKRYGLCVLNYIVTSNHIHLLVIDRGSGEIAKSMQLIAGRTAQEFNRRKARKGAFWEDRYHATAIDAECYLARCMTYIDLNMVRAGAVHHPSEWSMSGYNEIQFPPIRYAVIDQLALLDVFELNSAEQLRQACRETVEAELQSGQLIRSGEWSEGLAVGETEFVNRVKLMLGMQGKSREVVVTGVGQVLNEFPAPYRAIFDEENACLSKKDSDL